MYPTNGVNNKIPDGDIMNIKVGVGGQVASKVLLDSVQQFSFPSITDQGFINHVIPPAVTTNVHRPPNNKKVTPVSITPVKHPPTNTNDFYDGR